MKNCEAVCVNDKRIVNIYVKEEENLKDYLKRIASIPVLSSKEEKELAKRIKKGEILYYDYNAGGYNSYNTEHFVWKGKWMGIKMTFIWILYLINYLLLLIWLILRNKFFKNII